MNWTSTGDDAGPRLLCVAAHPFGPRMFTRLAQTLVASYRVEAAVNEEACTPDALVSRVGADDESPCLLVLQGLESERCLARLGSAVEAFAGLVVLGGPPPAASLADSEFGHWFARHRTTLAALDPEDRFELLLRHLGEGRSPIVEPFRSALREEAGPVGLEALFDASADGDALPRGFAEATRTLPALHIRGDRDRTAAGGSRSAPSGSEARTAMLPGVGHFPGLEAADMTATLIDSFARMVTTEGGL